MATRETDPEIVARGLVTGITATPAQGVVTVRKSEQLWCPRCHATDMENVSSPCSACNVLYHPDCLSEGCVSFNCRIVGTRVGTAEPEDLPDVDWGDWQDAPEGSTVSYTVPQHLPLHGPAPHRWGGLGTTTVHEVETLVVKEFREGRVNGDLVVAEVETDDGEVKALVTTDRAVDEYRAQLFDQDPTDYMDRSYLADIAMEALRDGNTVDFAQVWRDEVESRIENEEMGSILESLGYEHIHSEPTLKGFLENFNPDFLCEES